MQYFNVRGIGVTLSAIMVAASCSLPMAALAQVADLSPAPQTVRVPAGTTIQLEFVDTLSSKTNTVGQTFALRLREPIMLGEQTVVPAGALGGGEVIDVSRSGMGGRSGKLILSGRYLDIQGQRVRIRGLQSVLAGTDRSRTAVNTVILVPYVGFLGGFIQGGDIEVASGTQAQALLAADLVVPVPIASPALTPQAPPALISTTPDAKGNP